MEGDVKNIRLLGQGHTVCARAWTDLRARRDCTLPGALRRHRRASQEDAQSRRAGGGGRGPLRNSGKIQERRYFFLGLFHWTGDYQAVRAVAGEVTVGALAGYVATGVGEPREQIKQCSRDGAANDLPVGGKGYGGIPAGEH